MYDAKKENTKKNHKLTYDCIATTSYFGQQQSYNMLNTKTSYIPLDNIFY